MTDIFVNDRVLYICTCGSRRPITGIYFCRHCSKLRCGDCVSNEVDSNYCANCLEYMPSPEARLKKNRCASCFDCPSCQNTLNLRATSIAVPDPEDPSKTLPKKMYYLSCSFCRWTSRDVGLPDHVSNESKPSGAWPEPESPYSKRTNELFEYYRVVAHRDKLEKDKRKATQRCGYFAHDRFGVSLVMSKKHAGMSVVGTKPEDIKITEDTTTSEATDVLDEVPLDFFEQALDITKVTTLQQRLLQPDTQPVSVTELFPKHKHLLIKRSQRCRECKHNLSKPEYNPASIKFKIQLSAFYHIPEVKLKAVTPLVCGQECFVELTICNPTAHETRVRFEPLVAPEIEGAVLIYPEVTSPVVNPSGEFVLPAKDDTADFDDHSASAADAATAPYKDTPGVVTFRKGNKIGIMFKVVPAATLEAVIIGFMLVHTYTHLVMQVQPDEKRQCQVVELQHPVIVNLGESLGTK